MKRMTKKLQGLCAAWDDAQSIRVFICVCVSVIGFAGFHVISKNIHRSFQSIFQDVYELFLLSLH